MTSMLSFEEEAATPQIFEENEHPFELFIQGNQETRRDIILHHPDVHGFLFIQDDNLTKAYLPKKLTNFKAPPVPERHTIASVSGSPDEYIPFTVTEATLLSDTPHFFDGPASDSIFQTSSISKFLKDNRKDLHDIPSIFSTENKSKNARSLSLPLILLLVKGSKYAEGPLDSQEVITSTNHSEILKEWLKTKKADWIINQDLIESGCPLPIKNRVYIDDCALSVKVVFKTNQLTNNPFHIMKKEVEDFKKKTYPPKLPLPQIKVPSNSIDLNDELTIVTSQSKSEEAKIVEKNEKVILFYALLFSKPQYDKNGAIVSLLPGDLSDEALEVLSSASSVSEQARLLGDSFRVLSEDISKERSEFKYR